MNLRTVVARDALRLAKSSYYAPLPMLVLERDGKINQSGSGCSFEVPDNDELLIRDFNVALRVLMEGDVASYRDRPASDFLRHMADRVQGPLIPELQTGRLQLRRSGNGTQTLPEELKASAERVQFHSKPFGEVILRCTTVGTINPYSKLISSAMVYMELTFVERENLFNARFAEQQDQQLTWEEYAISYDLILSEMEYYQEVLKRHLDALQQPDIRRVIDIGAGTGNVTVPLLESGREVIAVDISRAMLDYLESKITEIDEQQTAVPPDEVSHNTKSFAGLDTVRSRLILLEQTAEALPRVADGVADGVNVLLAMFDMANPEDALNEAIRVLRPGGVIVITEPKDCFRIEPILDAIVQFLVDQPIDDAEQEKRLEDLVRAYFHLARANWKINPKTRSSGSPLRAEKILTLLKERGFRQLTIKDSHFQQCATICGVKPSPALVEN